MPTPDTETLAARIRAVERALTDEDAELDRPTAARSADQPQTVESTDALAGDRTTPADAVEQRLCRLEASVQALRAALGGNALETAGRGDENPGTPDNREPTGHDDPAPEDPGPRITTEASRPSTDGSRPPRRVPDGGHWPDDLGPE